MALEGFKYWADGEPVTGVDANTFLMSQSVMRFENASDRDSALARTLTTGMVAYLKDTTTLQIYDGTSWVDVALGTAGVTDHGALTGLNDDDHTQYLLADGTRTATNLTVSGDMTVDTSTFHVDSTNNRVGINDNTPSYALDVAGNGRFTSDLTTDGKLYFGNSALISSEISTTNIDHIWHNDSQNAWHFCSDTTYRANGNSEIHAGQIHVPGNVVAMHEFWDSAVNRSVTSSPQNIYNRTITTQGNTRLIFQVVTAQFIKSSSFTNLQLRFWVDGSQLSFGSQMLDTDHIGYGQSGMREQMVTTANTGTLSAGSHTIQVRASAYGSHTITLNYQSQGRSSHLYIWEVCV